MKNYFTDKNALDIPWVESPFFTELLNNSDYTTEEKDLLESFNKNGYVVIDLELTDNFINDLIADLYLELDKLKTQDNNYHYSDAPRLFEAWKTVKNVLELARHPKLLNTLELLYGRKPIPFQTINFLKGSNQPLHQDSIHFYTQPQKWMVGTWTALQDITNECGPLNVVPTSHKLPHYTFQDLNLEKPNYNEQFDNYHEYENYLIQLVDALKLAKKNWLGKKGECLIWASNLLHGGAPIIDVNSTRYAQATHFYFEGCNHYYSPMFSDITKGEYADKNLSQKDILNHTL